MKVPMFSLLDVKSGIFNTPFFMVHPAQAMRACVDLASDLNTTVGRHPADYALLMLGTFDDQTASVELEAKPIHLGLVVNMLPPRPENHSLPGINRPRDFKQWQDGPPSGSDLPAHDPVMPTSAAPHANGADR